MFLDDRQLEYRDIGIGYNLSFGFPYMHNHSYWEIMYVRKETYHYVNGKKEILSPHTITVIRPSDNHLIIMPAEKRSSSFTHLNLKISDNLFRTLTTSINEDLYTFLLNNYISNLTIGNDLAGLYNNYMYSLMNCNDDELIPGFIKCLIYNFLSYVTQQCFFAKQLTQNAIPKQICDLIEMMNNPENIELTVEELTKTINYSYMQIYRLFKKYMGVSPHEYFQEIKFNKAKLILMSTNKSVLETANDIGIYSLSHFDHEFKKRYGCTPKQFRETIKNSEK